MSDKELVKQKQQELLGKRTHLLKELEDVDKELAKIDIVSKPFVVGIQTYHGDFHNFFETLEEAEKELENHVAEPYFNNQRIYGVYIFKRFENGINQMWRTIPLQKYFKEPKF